MGMLLRPIKLRKKCRKCVFFLLLVLTMLPISLYPMASRFTHEIHNSPRVINGVIDLAGYDFKNNGELPLDGEWEFYWKKWLVTDGIKEREPDMMIDVPKPWNWYGMDGERLPEHGYASYRIRLDHAPLDSRLMVVVPNLAASYRVFIDGQLVSASGVMSKEPRAKDVSLALAHEWLGWKDSAEQELIIEVSSANYGGLYLVPMMMDDWQGYLNSRLRYVLAILALGILLVTVVGYAYVLVLRSAAFHSITLLVLDVFVMIRILLRDELFCILKEFLPFINYHLINSFLQIATLFIPVAFMLCAKELVGIRIKKREILAITIYELVCCIPMFIFFMKGFLLAQYILCIIGMLPYILVLSRMYQRVKEEAPFSLMVSAGMLLTISSLVVANQYATGLLYINASLYPSFCFVLAVCLQDYVYIRRSSELQAEALEAANLRVKLQEAEVSMMLSQIKPHFLYNALIAIQVLCTKEPETAEEAVMHFAKYLRMNMRSINSSKPIPFSEELEHIRNYVAIEKLRFKDRLTMRYEIEEEDFCVPPLTIQPLVENSIKHGACKQVAGGTVTLHTYRTPEYDCVEIIDDGPGFDPSIMEQEDSQSYGLKNISFRLKQMMQAEIQINSGSGTGTKVTVRFPRITE